MHMDIDSFFASVATIIHPEFKGKPLCIASGNNRSIVSSASYEAREYGIHAGMPAFKAKALCPDVIFSQLSFQWYINLSNEIFKILTKNKKIKIQVSSIDECFLDISLVAFSWNQAKLLAQKFQNIIYVKTKLNVSFGISFNKFTAKMATNLEKPKGISIITKQNFQQKLWSNDISTFYGIGKQTVPKVHLINIKTIGDLAKKSYDDIQLKNIFGKNANNYIDLANGIGNNIIETGHKDPKSISKSETFIIGVIDNKRKILEKINDFSKFIALELQNKNLVSLNIHINIAYGKNLKNKINHTHQRKLRIPVFNNQDIYKHAKYLLDNNWNGQPIRLIGVGANNLINKYDAIFQQTIYDNNSDENGSIKNIINKINSKFRQDVLMLGTTFYDNDKKLNNKASQSRHNNSSFMSKDMI